MPQNGSTLRRYNSVNMLLFSIMSNDIGIRIIANYLSLRLKYLQETVGLHALFSRF